MSANQQGFDAFGNPVGKAFDLGGVDDERLRGEKILLYVGYIDEPYEWHHAQSAVSERNMQMEIVPRLRFGKCPLDERTLSGFQQIWMVSDRTLTLSRKQIGMICEFAQSGGGLLLWPDNDPYLQDANAIAGPLMGSHFSGNKPGNRILSPGQTLAPGLFIDHPLTSGVNQLFEGHTICTIAPARNLTILAQSHDGQYCMGCYEKDKIRVALDTGFTKLDRGMFYKSAGTARYFRNIAFWLARGARDVEYKTFTPGRESLATINPGASSEKYKYTVTQPIKLTFILHWEENATLGLVIQDPNGRIVHDSSAGKAPVRVELTASIPGDWLCWVKGVSVPAPNFPYVLTLVQHKGAAGAASAVVTSAPPVPVVPVAPRAVMPVAPVLPVLKRLPVYVVLGGSGHSANYGVHLDRGVRLLANRLRGRKAAGAGASLGLILADESGLTVPLVEAEKFSLPVIVRKGKCSLGAALGKLNADIAGRKMDGKPLVFVFLTGAPDDNWAAQADTLKKLAESGKANVFVVGVGGYNDTAVLKRLTNTTPLSLPVLSQVYVGQAFEWLYGVADVVLAGMESGGASGSRKVPAPPACLKLLT